MAQAFSIESGNYQHFDRVGAYSLEKLATLLPPSFARTEVAR
jgi:hypothetical protein